MKSKKVLIILTVIAIAVTVFNTVGMVFDTFFYTMEDLPKGTLRDACTSPDGTKVVNTYVVENPLGNAVRCEVVEDGKTRNFYWEIGVDSVNVTWTNNELVYINGKYYDYRNTYDSRAINEELNKYMKDRLDGQIEIAP
ncbi:MAG: hypothetical protein IKL44_00515 [Clostridia bacterium]|nr:hypothetical protein [Clostridia bacterium]MBR3593133.1 hypothetical protein [Clostridia bacterium]